MSFGGIIKPKTKFQKWMYENMYNLDLSMTDVADKLHMTRQNVSYHYRKGKDISYVNILGYCKAFGYNNPDEIYEYLSSEE